MDLAINYDNFNINFVYFYKPVPNSIIDQGMFNRIYYSTDLFTITGINIFCLLEDCTIQKYYNKYKIWFNINKNIKIINTLEYIEKMIISKINIPSKIPTFKLSEHIRSGNLKTFNEGVLTNGICIKISGIWQSKSNYGLTFKFQIVQDKINHQLKSISN